MPPKKSLALHANGAVRAKPAAKHTSTNTRSTFSDSDSDSDGRYAAELQSQPLRLSQTLLSSHNALKQYLLAPSLQTQPEPAHTPKKRGRPRKDELPSQSSPVVTASTPISRLKQATAGLRTSEDWRGSIHFDDIEEQQPKKRKPGRPPKRKYGNGKALRVLQPSKQRALKTAPQQLPEYKEQVSHHLVDLTDDMDNRAPTRRSSYNNRGKRVLSIGNGFVAQPHEDVSETDYYKVLDSSMSEPNQMRQLLAWCFRKNLLQDADSDHSAESDTARGIAKIIKQELLADLVDGKIETSWYSRESAADAKPVAGRRIIRPNPLNEANKESIEVFSRKLRQLHAEKKQWQDAFIACMEPLKGVNVSEISTTLPELAAYLLAKGNSQIVNDVVDNGIALRMEDDWQTAQACVEKDLHESTDKLYHLLHRLEQSVGLAAKLEQDRLTGQVARVVHKFMSRCDGELQQEITNKQLLRGIARMDAPQK